MSWRGIPTGHACQQAPHREEALGTSAAPFDSTRSGVRTAPIGPGYTHPYPCPPVCRYTGQTLRHAPHRMHASISVNSVPRMLERPLSTTTTCNSRGPSSSFGRRAPVMAETYVVMGWPVAARGSRARRRSSCSHVSTTRSMPSSATWTGGTEVARRPLPSLEGVADLGPVLVDRWNDDVRRGLTGELDDPFSEVGLGHLGPDLLECFVEGDLLAQHGFGLHDPVCGMGLHDPANVVASLLVRSCPMHLGSHRFQAVGKTFEDLVEATEHFTLGGSCLGADFLRVRELCVRGGLTVGESVRRSSEVGAEPGVRDLRGRPFSQGCRQGEELGTHDSVSAAA